MVQDLGCQNVNYQKMLTKMLSVRKLIIRKFLVTTIVTEAFSFFFILSALFQEMSQN